MCEKQGGREGGRENGRAPNQVELAMYSLLWSEHCAYKHSKKLLRTLPTEGRHVVMGPGENAGAVDVGGGIVCAFKVESHNHPSAVEPFQGAATGVGGILRDIFAIGARPIAVLDSLRFGEPGGDTAEDKDASGDDARNAQNARAYVRTRTRARGDVQSDADPRRPGRNARARYLLDGAVRGIGHYGNSIGVPTIGGEVYFEGPYEQNCLVNAMALGLGEREKLVRSAAAGPGNVLVLFGARTGRDGIGGASVLASAELGDADAGEDKRPTVQVGDPFEEKKLLECSLELLERGLIVALQDLGAAGLTSSAAEMASKGEVGIDLDVARVPLREPGMEPFEVMVSESQERMLCVVEPANVEAVKALCEKWEVNSAAIGTVTESGRMRIFDGEELVGDMPVRALVDDCPLYDLAPERPAAPIYAPPRATLSAEVSPREALLALLRSPNIASRRPLFEQYDAIVQSRTVRRPEQADAAVLALDHSRALAGERHGSISADGGDGSAAPGGADDPTPPGEGRPIPGLGVSIDCNGRRVAADPYRGTIEAALECAANLACVGAEPLGTTNNLNFGNPEKGHIAWQLTESVRGLGDACRALEAPIVGGNVSLYNESPPTRATAGPIYPTPVVGMVGRLPDVRRAGRLGFARAGDAVALVGPFAPSLAASELAKLRGEALPDGLPQFALDAVIAAQALVREAVRAGACASAHDIAEGGLAVALAECCLAGGLGADIALGELFAGKDPHEALFGESSGGFILSGPADALRELTVAASRAGVAMAPIGTVSAAALRIDFGGESLSATLEELIDAHTSLRELFP